MRAMLREPSTYAGLAAVVAGVGQIADSHAIAPAIGQAITQVAPQIISGNLMGALMSIFGFAAIFLREKGNAQ